MYHCVQEASRKAFDASMRAGRAFTDERGRRWNVETEVVGIGKSVMQAYCDRLGVEMK